MRSIQLHTTKIVWYDTRHDFSSNLSDRVSIKGFMLFEYVCSINSKYKLSFDWIKKCHKVVCLENFMYSICQSIHVVIDRQF